MSTEAAARTEGPGLKSAPKIKDYLDLARPFTLLAPFFGTLAGALIACGDMGSYELILKGVLAGITGSLLNAASNAINQYYDLKIDAINKPDRPLPSGRMTVPQAMTFAWILYAVSVILGFLVNPYFLIVVLISAAFTWGYSAPPIRFKNNGIFANIAMAVPRGYLMIVGGWVAIRPEDWANPTPWLIGTIIFLFVVGAASTKDFADVKGDKEGGAFTVVVVYGYKKAAWIIAPFFVIPYLALPIIALIAGPENLRPQAMWLSILALWGAYTAWLILRDPDSLALEGNHPSWKHMYMLMMATQLGFAVIYALPQ
ncbi:MAG: UbiA family prenyltransferase [bacterium]|nr:UbiA family prenyltransferase [bacterium]